MNEKKSSLSYYLEALREAGILIIVFGPMYCIFDKPKGGEAVSVWEHSVLLWLLVGFISLVIGIEVGRRIE